MKKRTRIFPRNTVLITDWDGLTQVGKKLEDSGRRWLYRGQHCKRWGLKPRIERTMKRLKLGITELGKIEVRILRQAQRNLHRYDADLPKFDDTIEWLSMLQHYGAPTRLLDWTHSFDIGLYFALEQAALGKIVSIFVADNDALVCEKEDQLKLNVSIYEAYKENDKDTTVDSYLLEKDTNIIVPIAPFRLNDRLAIQQGIFMISLSKSIHFDRIYNGMALRHQDSFYKLNIKCTRSLIQNALIHLQRINITTATLFPGIDGFCRGIENELADANRWKYVLR